MSNSNRRSRIGNYEEQSWDHGDDMLVCCGSLVRDAYVRVYQGVTNVAHVTSSFSVDSHVLVWW